MGRMTYRQENGSWGLKGLNWQELVALPPRVYGALAKLKDTEDLIDDIGNPANGENGVCELALETLMTMGSDGIHTNMKGARAWIRKRFEQVT